MRREIHLLHLTNTLERTPYAIYSCSEECLTCSQNHEKVLTTLDNMYLLPTTFSLIQFPKRCQASGKEHV